MGRRLRGPGSAQARTAAIKAKLEAKVAAFKARIEAEAREPRVQVVLTLPLELVDKLDAACSRTGLPKGEYLKPWIEQAVAGIQLARVPESVWRVHNLAPTVEKSEPGDAAQNPPAETLTMTESVSPDAEKQGESERGGGGEMKRPLADVMAEVRGARRKKAG